MTLVHIKLVIKIKYQTCIVHICTEFKHKAHSYAQVLYPNTNYNQKDGDSLENGLKENKISPYRAPESWCIPPMLDLWTHPSGKAKGKAGNSLKEKQFAWAQGLWVQPIVVGTA